MEVNRGLEGRGEGVKNGEEHVFMVISAVWVSSYRKRVCYWGGGGVGTGERVVKVH